MFYKIVPEENSTGTLFIPESFRTSYPDLLAKNIVTIKAGFRKTSVKLLFHKSLPDNCIKISKDTLDYMCIPSDITYQVKAQNNEINIGPVIGLLLSNDSDLTKKQLDEFLVYTLLYQEFRGLLYVFSPKDVNYDTQLIQGYYFKPDIENQDITWEKTLLPYPSAIYRRIGLASKVKDDLAGICNNNLFNSYYFNKWEFYNIMSRNEDIKNHIPETKLLNSFDDIDDMLNKFATLFIKPIDGSRAMGLVKIKKENTSYIFKQNLEKDSVELNTKEKAEGYINDIKRSNSYIVQEAVDCLTLDDRCIDFRVIMQKNNTLNWQCTGIVARIGMENGISSTYRAYGYALSFRELFLKLGGLKQNEIFMLNQEVIRLCTKFCRALDDTGEHYGDLGIDVMIDKNFKPWILEINKRHDHIVPLSINDRQMFYAVKSNPIKYAVGLSGFKL